MTIVSLFFELYLLENKTINDLSKRFERIRSALQKL